MAPRQRACCTGVMIVLQTEIEISSLGGLVHGGKTRSSVFERFSFRYREDMMLETAARQLLVFWSKAGVDVSG